jgi:hypothetical protein
MQQKLKSSRRKNARTKLFNVKMTEFEMSIVKSLSDKHGVTASQWARDAMMKWRPTKRDLVPLDETDPKSPFTLPEASETPPVNL